MSDMADDCYCCTQESAFDVLALRERLAYDDHWRVAHAMGTALPGWLVLLPRRHVMEIAGLTAVEASGLGAWQVRLARAFESEFGTPKTYVMALGELPGFHLHFHVVPRPLDLAPEHIGPKVFHYLGRTPETGELAETDRDAIAARLRTRLQQV